SPPTSVTRPAASGNSGVQAGTVYGATRISPFSSLDPSSLSTTRARPSTTPAEAPPPARAPSGNDAPALAGATSPSLLIPSRPAPPRAAGAPRPSRPAPSPRRGGPGPPAGPAGCPPGPPAKPRTPLPGTAAGPLPPAPTLPRGAPASRCRGPGRCSTWGVL